ncbi:MAG: cyclic nucleotide-binding domain-containing protein [Thermoanaerobaculia bacterium]|nr:cyclic nucleotide-binding domain-containing protein [Thermoanaerobaculia bacterium]
MPFKKWLRGSRDTADEFEYTVDELMTMDRFDEAKARLEQRLKYKPDDLHAHLKLGDVYKGLGDADSCKQEYLHVASAYASDGFYDRARAVLRKINRLFPGEIDVERKLEALKRAKRLDYSRDKARAGLLSSRVDRRVAGRMTLEFERIWGELSKTSLVDQISSQDFVRLFESVRVRRLAPGKVVAEPGSDRQAVFIIVSGAIEARAEDKAGHLISLRSFGPGEIVGESTLFKHRAWQAEYRTDDFTDVLELDRSGLEHLIEGQADPKRLLDVLRGQGNDEKVARAIDHLKK